MSRYGLTLSGNVAPRAMRLPSAADTESTAASDTILPACCGCSLHHLAGRGEGVET